MWVQCIAPNLPLQSRSPLAVAESERVKRGKRVLLSRGRPSTHHCRVANPLLAEAEKWGEEGCAELSRGNPVCLPALSESRKVGCIIGGPGLDVCIGGRGGRGATSCSSSNRFSVSTNTRVQRRSEDGRKCCFLWAVLIPAGRDVLSQQLKRKN